MDKSSSQVIHPYLVGRELATGDGTPSRFIIDLGERSILECQEFPAAFQHFEAKCCHSSKSAALDEAADARAHTAQIGRWWMHWRPRSELMTAIRSRRRYLACSRVTKRPIFVFVDSSIRPGDALQVFAFDDDYSFSVLQSAAHWLWFITKCSKLKSDFRYTPESVFETFPWPQNATNEQIDAVVEAGRSMRRLRRNALKTVGGGLRAVYRTLEIAGKNPLRDAHAALDTAVMAAYGFSAKRDLLAQLLKLNLDIAAQIATRQCAIAPGIPPDYPSPKSLVTEDCIRVG